MEGLSVKIVAEGGVIRCSGSNFKELRSGK